MSVFGQRGYNKGALVEVAEQAGHDPRRRAPPLRQQGGAARRDAAVPRRRGGRRRARPRADAKDPRSSGTCSTPSRRTPRRPGVVQTYTVLSAESVTEGHPAQSYFRDRFTGLRDKIAGVLAEVTGRDADESEVRDDASALIALMDGLQVQWLLDPDAVDMPRIVEKVMDELVDRLTTREPRAAVPAPAGLSRSVLASPRRPRRRRHRRLVLDRRRRHRRRRPRRTRRRRLVVVARRRSSRPRRRRPRRTRPRRTRRVIVVVSVLVELVDVDAVDVARVEDRRSVVVEVRGIQVVDVVEVVVSVRVARRRARARRARPARPGSRRGARPTAPSPGRAARRRPAAARPRARWARHPRGARG